MYLLEHATQGKALATEKNSTIVYLCSVSSAWKTVSMIIRSGVEGGANEKRYIQEKIPPLSKEPP